MNKKYHITKSLRAQKLWLRKPQQSDSIFAVIDTMKIKNLHQ